MAGLHAISLPLWQPVIQVRQVGRQRRIPLGGQQREAGTGSLAWAKVGKGWFTGDPQGPWLQRAEEGARQ